MAIKNLPQREEYLRKRRNKKYFRWGIFFFIFLVLIGVISYLSFRPKVRINEFTLIGGQLVTQNDIDIESKNFLKGSYFWLFPKNNTFLVGKNDLEMHLANVYKRIETIHIERIGLNKLNVEITERQPIGVWCKELNNPEIIEKEKCYFIDLNGVIFDVAPSFSGAAYFKYYGLVDKENPIGEKYIASSTEFININKFIDVVKKLNINPTHLKSKESGEFSLVLYGGGEVYFDSKKSLEVAVSNLESLLKSPELKIINGYLPVEYVDLRYGNKLFYKSR